MFFLLVNQILNSLPYKTSKTSLQNLTQFFQLIYTDPQISKQSFQRTEDRGNELEGVVCCLVAPRSGGLEGEMVCWRGAV